MMLDEFFARLELMPHRWWLDGGSIRSWPTEGLRGQCCPISVLKDESCFLAPRIALEIGLSKQDAVRIIHAADWPHTPHKELRQRLLKACGLA